MKPRHNCIFHTSYGLCNHLDRGRGFFGGGRPCILDEEFVGSCTQQIKHPGMVPPPVDDDYVCKSPVPDKPTPPPPPKKGL